jgi:DNA-3-methyladenine glycosylase I
VNAAPADRVVRCRWATHEPLLSYHDAEWGTPEHDERRLFEFLVLEGAQAGLSWETVLRKRDAYRKAFDRFDPKKVARYGARDVTRLMGDAGIVRNRAKITSAIGNAQAFLEVVREHGTFDSYAWAFSDPIAMSRDLRRRGFRFVGPTIVESFMEATGIVDHHEPGCFRRAALEKDRRGRAPRGGGARPTTQEGGREGGSVSGDPAGHPGSRTRRGRSVPSRRRAP